MDWSGKAAPGTIAVSDPKMYRREALINERRQDVAWIDDLLDKSATIEFKPEIAREIETISSISAALGLNFDPASAVNYRRSSQTGELKQQIDVMQLQLQLDQLRRDAALFRAKLGDQTDVSNADLGKLGAAGVPAATNTLSAAAADQLKAAIDKLNAGLSGRLDATGTAAAVPTNVGENPTDLFLDRAAYRDALKAARNAASLDELHDFAGAALIRLNFQATIMPDRRNAAIPGIVQMRIVKPKLSDREKQRIYRGWLEYINERINVAAPVGQAARWKPDTALLGSGVMDNFDIIKFGYAKPGAVPPTATDTAVAEKKTKSKSRGALRKVAVPVTDPASGCAKLTFGISSSPGAGCSTLIFAVPKFAGSSAQTGATNDMYEYVKVFDIGRNNEGDLNDFASTRSVLIAAGDKFVSGCGGPADTTSAAYQQLAKARLRVVAGNVLAEVDRTARRMLAEKGIDAPSDPDMTTITDRTARAELLLRTFERFSFAASCTQDQRTAFRYEAGSLAIPARFQDLFDDQASRVAIYDVGPRDLSQQMSTVARAANSLSLAVSIAASAPSSGAAADAAAGYSRQAMGRAAELERLPAVVGYSVLSSKTFGWVIGPRASVEPKGRVGLDQSLRSYDLSADLSVPGWWPYFCLEGVTGWGARAADISRATLSVPRGAGEPVEECKGAPATSDGQNSASLARLRVATVSLSSNDSDYAWITSYVGIGDIDQRRSASLANVSFGTQLVSACRATTVIAQGTSLWRTTQVIIGGVKIPATGISVTPDMSGITFDVPALGDSIGTSSGATLAVSLLTPYGIVEDDIRYEQKPAAGCKADDKKVPDRPTVTSLSPQTIAVPGAVTFQIQGSKLDDIDGATLNGTPGKVEVSDKGKNLSISFTREQTESVPVSRTVPFILLKGKEAVVEKTIEATSTAGDK